MERMVCVAYIVLIASIFHHCVTEETHYPRIRYMEEECNLPIMAHLDMRLKLTYEANLPLKVNWTCRVTIQAEASGNMLLARYIDINTDYSDRCRKNGLKIYASNGTLMNGLDGDCGADVPKEEFMSGGEALTFEFHTDSVRQTGDFDILITPLTFSEGNGTCPDLDFRCKNKRCVSVYVTCNGYDDCGDYTDEIDHCSKMSTIIIGAVAGVLIVAVLISLVVFMAQYRRRKYRRLSRKSRHHSDTSHITHTGGYQNY